MSTQWCRKKGKVICTFQDSKDSKSNLLTVPTPENKEWGFGNFFNKTTISQFSETGRWHGYGGGEHGGEGSGQGGGVDLGAGNLSYFFPWTFEKPFSRYGFFAMTSACCVGGWLLHPLHPGVDLQPAHPLQRRQEQIPPLLPPLCHGYTCSKVSQSISRILPIT